MNEFDFKNLGLNTSASISDVKEVYRALSKIYHPDNKETGNTRIFRKLTQSYNAIEEEYKRRGLNCVEYDMFSYDIYDNLAITLKEAFDGCTKKVYWNDLPRVINIPNGVVPSDIIITKNQGLIGRKNGNKTFGDLILTIFIERNNEYFFDKHNKLCMNIDVDIFKALTGGQIKVQHIDNKLITIEVPQGFQNGYQLIIPKRGWYKKSGTIERGDLTVILNIKNRIVNFTDKQIRQLREMAKE